jgi:hypothetical protein
MNETIGRGRGAVIAVLALVLGVLSTPVVLELCKLYPNDKMTVIFGIAGAEALFWLLVAFLARD